jgi:glycosyltransferase involved in cell wall biosynthesis
MVGFSSDPLPDNLNFEVKTLPRQGNAMFSLLRSLIQGDLVIAYKLKLSSFGLALLHRVFHKRPVLLDIDDWEISWHGGEAWRYRPSLRQLARDVLKPGGELRKLDHPLYLKWSESLVPMANQVTTHCEFLQNRFGGVHLPNGKDVELFNPHSYDPQICRAQRGLSQYRVLMFPGAPRPYKGIEDLLFALDFLDQKDLKLVIVGGSPYDNYDDYLRQKWGRHIIQLPRTSYLKMPELIAAAHVVVVPQRDHPAARAQFPLKLTDGMAMAKPILATRVGDIPKILSGTGYLADPDQPLQLANQIESIFQNYDRALAKGQRARKRCVDFYSLDSMGRILSRVIDGLLA